MLYQLSYGHQERPNITVTPWTCKRFSGAMPWLGVRFPFARAFGDDSAMGSRVVVLSLVLAGCVETFPDIVPLAPGADEVEVVSDPPNVEIYEPAGAVSASVAGIETSVAVREAKNALRNQAARRGATFVSIDEISSRASWDLRGKTIVSMTGTAYRAR